MQSTWAILAAQWQSSRGVMETGGYSYEFLDQVPDDYNCPICLCVLRDPSLTECCGHNFCQSCIKPVERQNGACPRCNAVRVRTVNNRQLRNSIATLKIRCKYYRENELSCCTWIGTLESLERHLSEGQEEGECKFVPVKCQHGCNEMPRRHCFQQHLSCHCPQRPYQCEHCGFRKSCAEVIKHYRTCPKYPVACPNRCCTTVTDVQRRHLKDHLNVCPLEEVQCEFHFAGCTSKMKRRDVQKHMDENTQGHLSLLAKELKEQRNSNNKLKRKYNDIEEELEDIKRKRKRSDSSSDWDYTW